MISSSLKSGSGSAFLMPRFFSELKQWAGDAGVKKAIRIRDRQDNDYLLKAFRELTDEDLNPIELYAYYLGLYIKIRLSSFW